MNEFKIDTSADFYRLSYFGRYLSDEKIQHLQRVYQRYSLEAMNKIVYASCRVMKRGDFEIGLFCGNEVKSW